MADISSIREGLATLLTSISGLNVHRTAPDSITGPAVLVAPATDGVFLDYDSSFDGDSDDYAFTLHLLVDRRNLVAAQEELDSYLARSGSKSVFAAVNGGTIASVHFAVIEAAREYGRYTYADDEYLGCLIDVTVSAG